MRRKLVKQGHSSYTLSLPAQWVKNNNLKEGKEVEVEESDQSLLVYPPQFTQVQKVKADTRKFSTYILERFIARNYHKGVDELDLQIDNSKRDIIQSRINDLMGFVILEHNNDRILIKDVSKDMSLDFTQLVRKTFFVLKEMGQLLEEAVQTQRIESIEEITKRDSDVNKYTYFCLRHISKFGCPLDKPIPNMFFILHMLEDIGDGYKKWAEHLKNKSKTGALLPIVKGINALFVHAYEHFYTPKDEHIVAFQNQFEDNKEKIKEFSKKTKDIESVLHMQDLNSMCAHILKNCL